MELSSSCIVSNKQCSQRSRWIMERRQSNLIMITTFTKLRIGIRKVG